MTGHQRKALLRIEEISRKHRRQTPRLLAVVKGQPVARIIEAYREGQRDFAENYVQDLVEKAALLRVDGFSGVRWHFIGHLQTNKVKALLTDVPELESIHSIGSLRLAEAVSNRMAETSRTKPLDVFLEVNIDAEESKTGFSEGELEEAARIVSKLPGLSLQGLMCIPKPASSGGNPRAAFARLRALEETLRPKTKGGLSMGMSGDFEDAVVEGATHVRLGTLLFGPR